MGQDLMMDSGGSRPAGSEGLRFASFSPGCGGGESPGADARTANWFEAVQLGFHEQRANPAHLPDMVAAYQRDGRTLTAVYDEVAPEHAVDPAVPVATYAAMVNNLNVGGGQLLPAHLITSVTVRPTHRRRGILRAMITADLWRAKAAGLSVAALTASEATIYGRFGFGAASSTAEIRLDTRGGLDFAAPRSGSIAVADNAQLKSLAPDIYRAHLGRTFGSLGRQYGYWMRASGHWSEEGTEPDKALRGVIHYTAEGRPDGYATYKSLGWQTTPHTVRVTDLVAANDEAYRELWRYLGSIDLVDRLTFGAAPVEDPLPWMLADRRRYQVTGVSDVLWLRILEAKGALEARRYTADAEIVLAIRDPLGLADGTWHLRAAGGRGQAAPLESGAETGSSVFAEIDAAALGSLYLGGVSAHALAAAGGIQADQEALNTLDALFTAGPAPYCSTHF